MLATVDVKRERVQRGGDARRIGRRPIADELEGAHARPVARRQRRPQRTPIRCKCIAVAVRIVLRCKAAVGDESLNGGELRVSPRCVVDEVCSDSDGEGNVYGGGGWGWGLRECGSGAQLRKGVER